jgi:hypothetical protein
MMEAVSTAEPSANFIHNTRRNFPQNGDHFLAATRTQ